MEEFILKERETKEKIAEVLNTSGLPAVTIKSILKEFLEASIVAEQQEFEKAIRNKEEKEKQKNKEDKSSEKK